MITNNEKVILYDGLHFSRDKRNGYYHNTKTRKYLHQYIWVQANGEIPKGYHIHHIDHNKNNNNLSNLQLISPGEHSKHHWENNTELMKITKRNYKEKCRPAWEKWAKSEEGVRFFKEAGYKNANHLLNAMQRKSTKICENCGKEYEVNDCTKNRSRFCSNNCKSAWRRKANKDMEIRKCAICGIEFEANKYERKECCSRTCAGIKSSASRKGKPQPKRKNKILNILKNNNGVLDQ